MLLDVTLDANTKCLDALFDDGGFERVKKLLPAVALQSSETLLRYLVHHPDAWMELSLWRGTLRSDAYAMAMRIGLQGDNTEG